MSLTIDNFIKAFLISLFNTLIKFFNMYENVKTTYNKNRKDV